MLPMVARDVGFTGFVLVNLIGLPLLAESQERAPLHGIVRDSAGAPIHQADVGIVALHKLTRTDEGGRFRLDAVPAGVVTVSIRKIGFEPQTLTHTVAAGAPDTMRVTMSVRIATLPGVQVSEREMRRMLWIEDFYRRLTRGIGTYLTRDEIEARRAARVSDALRDMPGIRFVRVRGGTGVRFVSAPSNRRDCRPMIWVDGQRAPDMEVDDLPVNEIEGIELYHGPSTTPMQFSQGAMTTCGTIVVWSRVPGM
jgi:hypothetical protein